VSLPLVENKLKSAPALLWERMTANVDGLTDGDQVGIDKDVVCPGSACSHLLKDADVKRNSTLAWALSAWFAIGLCGCSSSNPFKKKPANTDLGLKPAETVPTDGKTAGVVGANVLSGPAANTGVAATTYPSTGMSAAPIGTTAGNTAKPAAWNSSPATAAKGGAAPGWTPSAGATANNAAPVNSQEGYYPMNYSGSGAPAASGLAGTKPAGAPDANAATGNPFSAPVISGGAATPDLRTADTRSSTAAGAVPWAARNDAATTNNSAAGGVAPWAAAGGAPITPAPAATPTGPEAWASSAGATTIGQDAAKAAAPRRDPHYRPGQTSDFQNTAPLTPTGASVAPPAGASVTPAGFAAPVGELPRRVEKVATEITPLAPWAEPTANSSTGGEAGQLQPATPSVPWAAGGGNADVFRR